MVEFTKRPAQRKAHCMSCDVVIEKGEDMAVGYTPRRGGVKMHFCLDCCKKIGELSDGK